MEKIREQRPPGYIKVVLYGPESTGKSTLSRKLTRHYRTALIPEFARDYLQAKFNNIGESCSYDDLIPIVRGQRAQEKAAIEQGHNLLICDTDLLETLVYSNAYFNKVPKPILDLAQNDHVDLYLLMNIDIPWERDDLRDRPEQRVVLFDLFRNELVTRNKKYVLVSGDATQRLTTAIKAIDTLLK
jgi:NadR type nicotinamide-nucleotide adenylyltransferase